MNLWSGLAFLLLFTGVHFTSQLDSTSTYCNEVIGWLERLTVITALEFCRWHCWPSSPSLGWPPWRSGFRWSMRSPLGSGVFFSILSHPHPVAGIFSNSQRVGIIPTARKQIAWQGARIMALFPSAFLSKRRHAQNILNWESLGAKTALLKTWYLSLASLECGRYTHSSERAMWKLFSNCWNTQMSSFSNRRRPLNCHQTGSSGCPLQRC